MSGFHLKSLPYLDSQSASNVLSLVNTCKTKQYSLALGAGVSASAGLPDWDRLLKRITYIYFEQWVFGKNAIDRQKESLIPPRKFSVNYKEMDEEAVLTEKVKKREQEFSQLLEKFRQLKAEEKLFLEENELEEQNNHEKIVVLRPEQKKEKKELQKLQRQKEKEELMEALEAENSLLNKNPVIVAQMIKNRIQEKDWDNLIRKALYGTKEEGPFLFSASPLMSACISLIKTMDIRKIINYNYDDTMYHALRDSGTKFDNVYSGKLSSYPRAIYYPYGYIPIKGGVRTEIMLAEQSYQKRGIPAELWGNQIQTGIYSTTPCIFLGLSMEEPSLRRLLHISYATVQQTHYAFLPRSNGEGTVPEMMDSLFDADLQSFGIKVIRYPMSDGTYKRLTDLVATIGKALRGEVKLL